MLEFAADVVYFSIAVSCLGAAFLVIQVAWDRFWTISFPIILEVYGRLRYPDEFTNREE